MRIDIQALMDTARHIEALTRRLEKKADPKTKSWWESYLQYTIQFRGVKMADIRIALHSWYEEDRIKARYSIAEQKALAFEFIRLPLAEDKLAGILFLQEILLPAGALDYRIDVDAFANLFAQGHIADWNTCDWLCVKVFGPWIQRAGQGCAQAIAAWKEADNLWQRRAAGVAFVNLAKQGDANFDGFTDMLLAVCASTIRSEERFAQTGTGWVLRELSYSEPDRVVAFIQQYKDYFSKDGWNYLLRKMPVVVLEAIG